MIFEKLRVRLWMLRFGIILLSLTSTGVACKADTKRKISDKEVSPLDILIDWQAEPTYLGIYYAKEKGYFSRAGFNASITQSWGANQAVAAVASGKYIVGTASGGATVLGRSKGAKVVSTAVLYPRIPSVVYGLATTGVRNPIDLKGKRIGLYPGSVTVNEFDAFLDLNGLKRGDLEIVSLSGADIPLLLARKVDAVLHYTEMSPVQVETSINIPGPSPKTFELKLADYGVTSYGLNVIVNEKAWRKQRPQLEEITAAILQGYHDGCLNREDAVREFLKEFPDKDQHYVSLSWDKVCDLVGTDPGAQDAAGWQRTIDLFRNLGLLKANVNPDQILGN